MADRDPTPHCIIYGNPADGFRIIGPFDCGEDARAYLWTEPRGHENMWIMELDVPDATLPEE